MKLLKITTFYPSYTKYIYSKQPGLAEKSYAEQKEALDFDAFGWADYWSYALTPLGYDVMEITMNVEPLQIAWARENLQWNARTVDLNKVALAQIKAFKPDILWFEDTGLDLVSDVRKEVPSIRFIVGWVGSAFSITDTLRQIDLILSCAPESVDKLSKVGCKAFHLHHAFDSRINLRLKAGEKKITFSFIGQLLRMSSFHLYREQLLEQLTVGTGLEIYSPSASLGMKDDIKSILSGMLQAVKTMGVDRVSFYGVKSVIMIDRPFLSVNPRLKPFLKPAVFGLDMFQVLCDSMITLNIHADSSPIYASNMRLFETTGVGTCLITDWKENLKDLFEADSEVVVYRDANECVEKVRWLLNHPNKCTEIAKAGQERTLRDHTFTNRAVQFDAIIRNELKH